MPTSNTKPKVILYIVGEARYITETIYEDDNILIIPTSATASLLDSTGASIATLAVSKSAGLIETVIPAGKILIPGNFTIEWDITYTKLAVTSVKTIITDIIAKYPDSSHLYTMANKMRVLINDHPRDPNKRIASDGQLKEFLSAAVRYYGASLGYTIITTLGVEEVDPIPVAESDAEKIIILYASYMYLTLAIEAIAREQTTLFSIAYDSAYAQILNRADFIYGEIKKLDPSATLSVLGETDIAAWGQSVLRRDAETAGWA